MPVGPPPAGDHVQGQVREAAGERGTPAPRLPVLMAGTSSAPRRPRPSARTQYQHLEMAREPRRQVQPPVLPGRGALLPRAAGSRPRARPRAGTRRTGKMARGGERLLLSDTASRCGRSSGPAVTDPRGSAARTPARRALQHLRHPRARLPEGDGRLGPRRTAGRPASAASTAECPHGHLVRLLGPVQERRPSSRATPTSCARPLRRHEARPARDRRDGRPRERP